MWHAEGIFFGLLKPLLNQVKAMFPLVGLPITADVVHACLSSGQVDVLRVTPSVTADLAGEPQYAHAVKALQATILGSGPMAKDAGDQLLVLQPNTSHFFGSTETDLLPLLRLHDHVAQRQYHRFHPHGGATFEGLSGGLYIGRIHQSLILITETSQSQLPGPPGTTALEYSCCPYQAK